MNGPKQVPDLLGVGLANWRSFDSQGFLLTDLKKVNVFIGRNNSGKSNVLLAIQRLRQINQATVTFSEHSSVIDGHRQQDTEPIATVVIPVGDVIGNLQLLEKYQNVVGKALVIRWNLKTGTPDRVQFPPAVDMQLAMGLYNNVAKPHEMPGWPRDQFLNATIARLIPQAIAALRATFSDYMSIPVFREIRQGGQVPPGTYNGMNIIKELRAMQVPTLGQDKKRKTFEKIEGFVRLLLNEPRLEMQIPEDDIILIKLNDTRLPLQSYGTGLHHLVIMGTAIAICEKHAITIEEPEIHLHPELQRKFLKFISEETANTYYISTHSNVFLDAGKETTVYHVQFDGRQTTVVHTADNPRARTILRDMAYKASDLLQSNGILWVEGPSDRIYLNRWIELMDSSLIEGIHYSILFYGSWPVLTHFTCLDNPIDDLVEALRVNSNAVVVVDRDGKESEPLRKSKQRILDELGADSCWVTLGREIENYLAPSLLTRYVSQECGQPVTLQLTKNSRLASVLKNATKSATKKLRDYDKAKVAYAREFCKVMTPDDLDVLDLRPRVEAVIAHIRRWNHVEPTASAAPQSIAPEPPGR